MDADEIKELRKRLNLTTLELAEKIGVTVDTVRKYEQGDRIPSRAVVMHLERLADPLREQVPA